jgi:hypothetical protein
METLFEVKSSITICPGHEILPVKRIVPVTDFYFRGRANFLYDPGTLPVFLMDELP